ncbi:uncharacterized protein TNCV_285431 [Trichonephila clavipes]|nr:uncharacterized protein TNCV_285431 [Trichonephila clavipes]
MVPDNIPKAAASDPVDPEDHVVLKSTEIYFRANELICRTWLVSRVYPWYFQRHPGSAAISFKGSRSYQTAFSRFLTNHLRCMNFEGRKRSFPIICTKCDINHFTPQNILQCLRFFCEEVVVPPPAVLRLLVYGLYGLMWIWFSFTRIDMDYFYHK